MSTLAVRAETVSLRRPLALTTTVFVGLGCGYVTILGTLMILGEPFPPPEPFGGLLHALNLAGVITLLFFWTFVHMSTPRHRAHYSLASLLFVVVLAVGAGTNRFLALTLVPAAVDAGHTDGLEWFQPYDWPSVPLAMEMLGWGPCFAIACLSLLPVFTSSVPIRVSLAATAALCLLSTYALASGNIAWIGVIAPFGWGIGPIVITLLITGRLRRGEAASKTPSR